MLKRIIRAAIILIIAAIITIALQVWQTKKYQDWIVTKGEIYNLEEVDSRHSKGGKSKFYRLYYSYRVAGVEYTGMDSYSGKLPDHYYLGKSVKIMYDPNEPTNSLHDKPKTELITRLPVLWSIPIALMMLLPMKKQKQQRRDFWHEMEKRGMRKEEVLSIFNKDKKS